MNCIKLNTLDFDSLNEVLTYITNNEVSKKKAKEMFYSVYKNLIQNELTRPDAIADPGTFYLSYKQDLNNVIEIGDEWSAFYKEYFPTTKQIKKLCDQAIQQAKETNTPKEKLEVLDDISDLKTLNTNFDKNFLTDFLTGMPEEQAVILNDVKFALGECFFVYRENGFAKRVEDNSEVTDRIKNYQQNLWQKVITFLKSNYTDVMLERLYDEDTYTNVMQKYSKAINTLFNNDLASNGIAKVGEPMLWKSQDKQKYDAYVAWHLLTHFDSLLEIVLPNKIQHGTITDGSFNNKQYSVINKSNAIIDTWRTSDNDVNFMDETDISVKIMLEMTPKESQYTSEYNKYLKMDDVCAAVESIRLLFQNNNLNHKSLFNVFEGIFQGVEADFYTLLKDLNTDTIKWLFGQDSVSIDQNDSETFSELNDYLANDSNIKNSNANNFTFSRLYSEATRNPQKYFPILFDLIGTKNVREQIFKQLNIKNFDQSVNDTLNSLNKYIFNGNESVRYAFTDYKNSYAINVVKNDITNGNKNYFEDLCESFNSLVSVRHCQYYTDNQGKLILQEITSNAVSNKVREIREKFNNKNCLSEYLLLKGKYNIQIDNTKKTVSIQLDEKNTITIGSNDKLNVKDDFFKNNVKSIVCLINDVLGINLSTDEFNNNSIQRTSSNASQTLFMYAIHALKVIAVQNYFTNGTQVTPYVQKSKILSFFSDKNKPKYLDNVDGYDVCMKKAGLLENDIAFFLLDRENLLSSRSVKMSDYSTLTTVSASRLYGKLRDQWTLLCGKDTPAENFSLFDLYDGVYTIQEYYNGETSKKATDFNVNEYNYSNFLYDFIGGFLQGDDVANSALVGNRKIAILPSVNADKTTIAKLIIDLNKVLKLQGGNKEAYKCNINELCNAIKIEIGNYYLRVFNTIKTDFADLFSSFKNDAKWGDFAKIKNPFDDNFSSFNALVFRKFGSDRSAESVLKEIVKDYNLAHPTNLFSLIDQVYYGSENRIMQTIDENNNTKYVKIKGLAWNRTIVGNAYRFSLNDQFRTEIDNASIEFDGTQSVQMHDFQTDAKFWQLQNIEILKSLIDSQFEINLANVEGKNELIRLEQILNGEDKNPGWSDVSESWIRQTTKQMVLGRLQLTDENQNIIKTIDISNKLDLIHLFEDVEFKAKINEYFSQNFDNIYDFFKGQKSDNIQSILNIITDIRNNVEIDNNIAKLHDILKAETSPVLLKHLNTLKNLSQEYSDYNKVNNADYTLSDCIQILGKLQNVQFKLNPVVERYNLFQFLFGQEFLLSTVGSHASHPPKLGEYLVDFNSINEESARFNAQNKRNVSETASKQLFSLNKLNGIPEDYNIAVIEDIKDTLYNVNGSIENGVKPYDGATFTNPFDVYQMNNSLGSAAVGTNTKPFIHFYHKSTGCGGIIKTAGFAITNSTILKSDGNIIDGNSVGLFGNLMKKMTKINWKDRNGEEKIYDITKNFLGESTVNAICSQAYFQLGNSIYKLQNIKFDKNTQSYQVDFAMSESVMNEESIGGKALGAFNIVNNQTKQEILKALGLEIVSVTDAENNVDFNVRLKNNYDLWCLFGRQYSVERAESSVFVQSENSIKNVVFLQNQIGEIIDKNNKTITSQDDVYQPLKHADINLIVTAGAIKHGAANINSKDSYYNDDPLQYFKVKLLEAGIQLDKEHTADSAEISLMTQVIAAAAHGGYTSEYASQLYTTLANMSLANIAEILTPFAEYINANTNKEKLLIEFKKSTLKVIAESVLHGKDGVELVKNICNDLVLEIKKEGGITKEILDKFIEKTPTNNATISSLFYKELSVFLNKNGIKQKWDGSLSVLNPSKSHIKIFNGRLYSNIQAEAMSKFGSKDLFENLLLKIKHTTEYQNYLKQNNNTPPEYTTENLVLWYVEYLQVLERINPIFELNTDGDTITPVWKTTDGEKNVIDYSQIKCGNWYEYVFFDDNNIATKNKIYLETPVDRRDFITKINNGEISSVCNYLKKGSDLRHYDAFFTTAEQEGVISKRLSMLDTDAIYLLYKLNTKKFTEADIEAAKKVISLTINELQKGDQTAFSNDLIKRFKTQKVFDKDLIQKCLIAVKEDEKMAISPTGKQFSRKNTVVLNGELVKIDSSKTKVQSAGCVMAKTAAENFGLKKSDSLYDIQQNKQFFSDRLQNVVYDAITENPIQQEDYDLQLISSNGKKIFFKIGGEFPNGHDFSQVNMLQKTIDGRRFRTDENDKIIYELNKDNVEKLFVNINDPNLEIVYLEDIDALKKFLKSENYLTFEISSLSTNDALIELAKSEKDNPFKGINIYKNSKESIKDINSNVLQKKYSELYITTLQKKGEKIYNSFQEYLHIIASRTPAQSMQSYMAMTIEGFTDENVNNVYVSTMQIWLQGSDFDIDAASLATYVINKNGLIVPNSPYFNYSSTKSIDDCFAFLPFPNCKPTRIIPAEEFTDNTENDIAFNKTLSCNDPLSIHFINNSEITLDEIAENKVLNNILNGFEYKFKTENGEDQEGNLQLDAKFKKNSLSKIILLYELSDALSNRFSQVYSDRSFQKEVIEILESKKEENKKVREICYLLAKRDDKGNVKYNTILQNNIKDSISEIIKNAQEENQSYSDIIKKINDIIRWDENKVIDDIKQQAQKIIYFIEQTNYKDYSKIQKRIVKEFGPYNKKTTETFIKNLYRAFIVKNKNNVSIKDNLRELYNVADLKPEKGTKQKEYINILLDILKNEDLGINQLASDYTNSETKEIATNRLKYILECLFEDSFNKPNANKDSIMFELFKKIQEKNLKFDETTFRKLSIKQKAKLLKFITKYNLLLPADDNSFFISMENPSTVEGDENSAITIENENLKEFYQILVKICDKHNLFFSNSGNINNLNAALQNCQIHALRQGIEDPINQAQAQTPIDEATSLAKKLAATSKVVKAQRMKGHGNFSSWTEAIVDNQVGKVCIALSANGLKAFFALTQYCNQLINEEIDKTNPYKIIKDNPKQTITNIDAFYANKVLENIQLNGDKGIKIYIPGKSEPEIKYFVANIVAKISANPKIREYIAEKGVKRSDFDAALTLSVLLSLSTDNAKELTLSKINASSKTLALYLYGTIIGVKFEDMFKIMTSDAMNVIMEVVDNQNSFEVKGNPRISDAFEYFINGPVDALNSFEKTAGFQVLQQFFNELNNKIKKNNKKTSFEIISNSSTVTTFSIANFLSAFAFRDINIISKGKELTEQKETLTDKIKILYQCAEQRLKDSPTTAIYIYQLRDFCERFIRQAERLKDNRQTFETIMTLARGASELQMLTQFLGLNQGVKTNVQENLAKIQNIEGCTNKTDRTKKIYDLYFSVIQDRYSNNAKSGKTNSPVANIAITDLSTSKKNAVVENYNKHKISFNVLGVITTLPHVNQYVKCLASLHESSKIIDDRYRFICETLDDVKSTYSLNSTIDVQNAIKGIGSFYDNYVLNAFLYDLCKGEEGFQFISDLGVFITDKFGKVQIKNIGINLDYSIGTAEGNAMYKQWFEVKVLPKLKTELDNKFIKDLEIKNIKVTDRKGEKISAYTLPINMMSKSKNEQLLLQVYKSSLQSLVDKKITIDSKGVEKTYNVIDLLNLYQLIVWKGKIGTESLSPVFYELVESNGILQKFYDFQKHFPERNNISLGVDFNLKDLDPYVVPTVYSISQAEAKGYYKFWKKNYVTKKYELFVRKKKNKQDFDEIDEYFDDNDEAAEENTGNYTKVSEGNPKLNKNVNSYFTSIPGYRTSVIKNFDSNQIGFESIKIEREIEDEETHQKQIEKYDFDFRITSRITHEKNNQNIRYIEIDSIAINDKIAYENYKPFGQILNQFYETFIKLSQGKLTIDQCFENISKIEDSLTDQNLKTFANEVYNKLIDNLKSFSQDEEVDLKIKEQNILSSAFDIIQTYRKQKKSEFGAEELILNQKGFRIPAEIKIDNGVEKYESNKKFLQTYIEEQLKKILGICK